MQGHKLLTALSEATQALEQPQKGKMANKRAAKSLEALAKLMAGRCEAAEAFQTPSAHKTGTGATLIGRTSDSRGLLDDSPQPLIFSPVGSSQQVIVCSATSANEHMIDSKVVQFSDLCERDERW